MCVPDHTELLHIAQKCIISTHHAIIFRKIVFREKCVVCEKQIIYLCSFCCSVLLLPVFPFLVSFENYIGIVDEQYFTHKEKRYDS